MTGAAEFQRSMEAISRGALSTSVAIARQTEAFLRAGRRLSQMAERIRYRRSFRPMVVTMADGETRVVMRRPGR